MITLTSEIHTALRRTDERFESAFANADPGSIAALYTDDAMLLPAGAGFVKGKDAIKNFWQGAMAMGIETIQLRMLEVEEYSDTAVSIGEYLLSGKDGQLMDQGKYLVVSKRQGNEWKLFRDIWTTSMKS